MQEQETHIWIADPEMTDGLSMTRIILKTAAWKEDTAGIAGKRTNGGMAVSGSAIGPAYVRMIRRGHLKILFLKWILIDFA
jgi:hypothetical protein